GALRAPAWRALFGLLRNVIRGQGRTLAEEKVLHVFRDELLCLFLPGHQAILVENHFHPLFPQLPRVERDVFVNALTEFPRPRRCIEPGKLFLELHAKDFASAFVRVWSGSRRWLAVVSHGSIVTPVVQGRW